MVKLNCRLSCTKETFNKINNECKIKFLKHNKEFKGMKISQEFILNRIARAYLDEL